MTSIYFAAPLFTAAERAWNADCAEQLRAALSATILVPQEFCAPCDQAEGGPDFGGIFTACVEHLDRCSHVLAVLDGADPDSGTCWEAGYAYAKGLPVIGLRTDWRPAEDGSANCMLSRSCASVVTDLAAAIAWFHQHS
ncbi:MAG: nucleoside 2-deoxyribosyltransferase [Planctomycetota bacterium]|jgi:nucleoside 2-deoxyribosyltransferase|nr:nucleoside 2-deoxyribosyltransferase [Planctomycetota bacterium]